ncbi:MAG: hypothetical protein JXR84_11780 [Anaerolineae bacterium]|nr:hypothetical protein [Anaerolineae bacterium]
MTTHLGIAAGLTTTDPYVSAFLVNDSSAYPDIPGGGTRQNLNGWEFAVDPATPIGHVITFTLDPITAANGGPWWDTVTYDIYMTLPRFVRQGQETPSVLETVDVTVGQSKCREF